MNLNGKVVLITGASSGIGAAIAKECVKDGAKVIATDILEQVGEELVKEMGENAVFLKLDITRPEEWASVAGRAKDIFGPITGLVNNAGYTGLAVPLTQVSDEDFWKTISIDLGGTFFGMKEVIPQMLEAKSGSIVNITSIAATLHGKGNNSAYTAAKHGVNGLTKAAAVEFGEKNIRVNAIMPGMVLTPMLQDQLSKDQIDQILTKVPLNRMAEPVELARTVSFLLSNDSTYLNGACIAVDGGWTAQA